MKKKFVKFKDILYSICFLFGSIAIWIQVTDNYPWRGGINEGPLEGPIMFFSLFFLPLILYTSLEGKFDEISDLDSGLLKFQILIITLFAIGNLFL